MKAERKDNPQTVYAISPKPGDVIVMELPDWATATQIEGASAKLKQAFPDNRSMVVIGTVKACEEVPA